MITLKKILVPTDFGEAADAALTYARALAQRFHASIELLHVADDVAARMFAGEMYVPSEAQMDIELAARRQLDERVIDNDVDPITITALIVTSTAPAGTIVQHAKDTNVDLIIMGTHGRGAVAHLLMGSVAERVVRLAPCPVLVVRNPEHEFVVPDTLATTARA